VRSANLTAQHHGREVVHGNTGKNRFRSGNTDRRKVGEARPVLLVLRAGVASGTAFDTNNPAAPRKEVSYVPGIDRNSGVHARERWLEDCLGPLTWDAATDKSPPLPLGWSGTMAMAHTPHCPRRLKVMLAAVGWPRSAPPRPCRLRAGGRWRRTGGKPYGSASESKPPHAEQTGCRREHERQLHCGPSDLRPYARDDPSLRL